MSERLELPITLDQWLRQLVKLYWLVDRSTRDPLRDLDFIETFLRVPSP